MTIGKLALPPAALDIIRTTRPDRQLWLMKSLAVIGGHLHDLFSGSGPFENSGVSRHSCILASLAVRDFLIGAGFRNARVMPVAVWKGAMRPIRIRTDARLSSSGC